jgi:hypothetical protein
MHVNPADKSYPWPSGSEWLPCCPLSLLTTLVLVSPESECLLSYCALSLLTMPALGSLGCECLPGLTAYYACQQYLFGPFSM